MRRTLAPWFLFEAFPKHCKVTLDLDYTRGSKWNDVLLGSWLKKDNGYERANKLAGTFLPHLSHMNLSQTSFIAVSNLCICTLFKSLFVTLEEVPFTLIFHLSNGPSPLKSFSKCYLLLESHYNNENNWHLLNSWPVLPSENQRLMATYHFHNYSSLTRPYIHHDCTPLVAFTILRSMEFEVRQSEFEFWFHLLIARLHSASYSLL